MLCVFSFLIFPLHFGIFSCFFVQLCLQVVVFFLLPLVSPSLFFSSVCNIACGGGGYYRSFLHFFFYFFFCFSLSICLLCFFCFLSCLCFLGYVCRACRIQCDDIASHCPLLCLLHTWQRSISVAQLCDHRTWIEESVRRPVMLDVDGWKKRTRTPFVMTASKLLSPVRPLLCMCTRCDSLPVGSSSRSFRKTKCFLHLRF